MPSALTYIVLAGTANFFGSQPAADIPPSVPSTAPSPVQEISQHPATRNDYTSGSVSYKLHNEPKNWHEARRTCQEEGGHLAIINSAIEAETISQLFRGLNWNWVYIGFHDIFEEGEYVTLHGESLAKAGYEEWHGVEPDDRDRDEDCGGLMSDGTLADLGCYWLGNFVCEIPEDQPDMVQYQEAVKSTPTVELVTPVREDQPGIVQYQEAVKSTPTVELITPVPEDQPGKVQYQEAVKSTPTVELIIPYGKKLLRTSRKTIAQSIWKLFRNY